MLLARVSPVKPTPGGSLLPLHRRHGALTEQDRSLQQVEHERYLWVRLTLAGHPRRGGETERQCRAVGWSGVLALLATWVVLLKYCRQLSQIRADNSSILLGKPGLFNGSRPESLNDNNVTVRHRSD